MSKIARNIRFLVARRIVQALVAGLFIASSYFGWHFLKGNYSAATMANTIPLTDPYAGLQILLSGVWIGSKAILGMTIILVLYGVIAGRAFCSWVCPVNPLMDTASQLGKRIEKNKFLPALVSRKIRYWILALSLIISLIIQLPAFETVSPIGLFHRAVLFGTGSSWAILLAFFLFELVVIKGGWCGRLCPLGAFYALIGRFRLLRVHHKVENCTSCNKCFEVCPEVHVMGIVKNTSGTINNSECTNCARCIDVCNDNALKFGIAIKNKNTKQ